MHAKKRKKNKCVFSFTSKQIGWPVFLLVCWASAAKLWVNWGLLCPEFGLKICHNEYWGEKLSENNIKVLQEHSGKWQWKISRFSRVYTHSDTWWGINNSAFLQSDYIKDYYSQDYCSQNSSGKGGAASEHKTEQVSRTNDMTQTKTAWKLSTHLRLEGCKVACRCACRKAKAL